MTRVVRGADGRVWTITGEMQWRSPATADDFEHDVSAGHIPAILMVLLVLLLGVVLISWTPADVVVPAWLVLVLVLIILFFPVNWAVRRPWKVVAETGDDGEGDPTERWVGTIRGMVNVRQQIAKVARNIETETVPGVEGPLQPVS